LTKEELIDELKQSMADPDMFDENKSIEELEKSLAMTRAASGARRREDKLKGEGATNTTFEAVMGHVLGRVT
jgi:hypothetical protein